MPQAASWEVNPLQNKILVTPMHNSVPVASGFTEKQDAGDLVKREGEETKYTNKV